MKKRNFKNRKNRAVKRILAIIICMALLLPNISQSISVYAAGDDTGETISMEEETSTEDSKEEPKAETSTEDSKEEPKTETQTEDSKEESGENTLVDGSKEGSKEEPGKKPTEENVTKDPALTPNGEAASSGEESESKDKELETIPEETETVSGNEIEKDKIPEDVILEDTILANTVSENTVSENTVSENTVSENAIKEVSFEESTSIDGIHIKVTADKGVFPEGATLKVVKISNQDTAIAAAIQKDLAKTARVNPVVAFDITILDKEGKEIQPDTQKGSVEVTFTSVDTSQADNNANAELQMYHMEDSMKAADQVEASAGNGKVSFEAEHFSIYALAMITQPKGKGVEADTLVKSIELKKGGQVIPPESESPSGAELSLSDQLAVQYNLVSPLYLDKEAIDTEGTARYVEKGKTYQLANLPDELKIYGDDEFDVKITGTNIVFGTVKVTQGEGCKKVSLTIKDSIKDTDGDEIPMIRGAFVGFGVQFDLEKVGNQEDEELQFTDPNVSFHIIIKENQAEKPDLAKKGAYEEETGVINWEVAVTNKANPIVYDKLQFCDELSGDSSHVYVEDSFRMFVTVDGEETEQAIDSSRFSYDEEAKKITYEYTPSEEAGAVTTFKYQTKPQLTGVIQDGKLNRGQITLHSYNKVTLRSGADFDNVIKEVSASVQNSLTVYDFYKTGGKINKDGNIAWEITIDTKGNTFTDLTLYDSFSFDRNEKYTMELVAGTVKLDGKAADSSQIIMESGKDDKGNSYNWKYNIGTLGGDTPHKITYETVIKDYDSDYIEHNHSVKPKNIAWLGFHYDGIGSGEGGNDVFSPTVEKEAQDVKTSVIEKKLAKVYDKATHELTWTVTVNSNESALKDAVVKELVKEGQTLVSISDPVIGGRTISNYWNDSNKTKTTLSESDALYNENPVEVWLLKFGNDLNGKKATFQVVTKLTNPEDYANNKVGYFKNVVGLYKNYSTDPVYLDKAWDQVRTDITVLRKSGTYDYATQHIKWSVKVNESKVDLSEIHVEDVLPEGTRLVEGTVLLGNTPVTKDGITKPYYTYEEAGRKLDIYLPDEKGGEGDKTVTFETEFESIDDFTIIVDGKEQSLAGTNGSVAIPNTAILYTAENTGGVKATGQATINNQMLTKTGKVDPKSNLITYTVQFNQAGNLLPAKLQVIDTLSEGIQLDLASVTLYKATVNKDGVYEKGEEETGYTKSCEQKGNTTELTLVLPDRADNREAYVLEYQASIVDTTLEKYTNHITAAFSKGSQSADYELRQRDFHWGGGYLDYLNKAVVTKTNTEGDVLTGAVFALQYDGKTLSTKTTGIEGKVIFSGLSLGKEYTIVEIKAPAGYLLENEEGSKNSWTFTLEDQKTEKGVTVEKTFQNKKAAGTTAIYKVANDPESTPLSGAEFELFRVNASDEEVSTDKIFTSGSDGSVIFSGLEAGTYRIKEVKAPTGYTKSDLVLEFKVTIEHGENSSKGVVEGPYLVGEDTEIVNFFVNDKIPDTEDEDGRIPNTDPGDNGGNDGGNSTESSATGTPAVQPRTPQGQVLGAVRDPFTVIPDEATPLAPGVLGADRLPKTGGFFGTGIMYLIGFMLIPIGAFLIYTDKYMNKKGKKKSKDDTTI